VSLRRGKKSSPTPAEQATAKGVWATYLTSMHDNLKEEIKKRKKLLSYGRRAFWVRALFQHCLPLALISSPLRHQPPVAPNDCMARGK
jgi:hypothetical protein